MSATLERSDELEAEITELARAQAALASSSLELEQQGRIAAALARVGRELIGLSTTPAVLERLCALATEVLPCSACHALLWQRDRRVLVPTAAYGHDPEDWEVLRAVEIPETVLGSTLRLLDRGDPVEAAADQVSGSAFATIARRFGIARALLVPLRRRGEMVGILSAVLDDAATVFDPAARQIALGVAQLASLALENTWLVEQLAAANRLKSEFVATMSHELRTPLHVILGYNELLKDGGFGAVTSEQTEALGRIQRSGLQLLGLIDAILDLGRLEMGHLPVHAGELSLFELAVELQSEATWQKPGVALRFEVSSDLPRLRTDRVKLKSVLKNLIDNAVKFTERGVVCVSARSEKCGIEIAVSDTGPGIRHEALDLIFDPFRQLDSSDSRPHGGLGLGLYIVRRLIGLLNGEVSVQSEVGAGSTFCIWLPVAPTAETNQDAAPSSPPSPDVRLAPPGRRC